MDPNQEPQATNPVTPSIQPPGQETSAAMNTPLPTPMPGNGPEIHKKKKLPVKLLVIISGIGLLLIAITLVAFDMYRFAGYQKNFQKYEGSADYKDTIKSLKLLVEHNDGQFAKFASCEATTSTLWNYKSPEGEPSTLYVSGGYIELTSKIGFQLPTAEQNLPKPFKASFMTTLLPNIRTVNQKQKNIDNTFKTARSLIDHHEIRTYCTHNAYVRAEILGLFVVPLSKSVDDNEPSSTFEEYIRIVQTAKKDAEQAPVPFDMIGAHQKYLSAFGTFERGLEDIITLRGAGSSTVNVPSSFQAGTKELDDALKDISIVARHVEPKASDLQALLKLIGN